MKIKLTDSLWLNSDRYCLWLSETDGNGYSKRVSGYSWTFGQAVQSYIDIAIKTSDAEDIESLAADVEKIKSNVLAIAKINPTDLQRMAAETEAKNDKQT